MNFTPLKFIRNLKKSKMNLKKVFPIIAMLLIVLSIGCKKDEETGVRPMVTSTDPISNATGIVINSKISATFSVAMNPTTITTTNFSLQKGSAAVIGTVAYTGKIATFTPTENLAPNTVYKATITTGVKDVAGTSLAKAYSWSFTTSTNSDLVLPTVTLTNPVNGATAVTLNQLIVITFSEAMDPATIDASSVFVKQGTTAVSGAVTYTGTTATFTPTSDLAPNKTYTVTVTTEVKDMAGNAMETNKTFSFTTGEEPDTRLPMVQATDPLIDAIGVERNKVVAITFSEAMDPTTINDLTFTLKQGTNVVPGTVAYSGTKATFTTTNYLAAKTVYTATITTGAKDLAGNALAVGTTWSFTTGGYTSILEVVELGAAINYVILAKTAISNVPTSAITGNLGLSPAATSYITGFALTDATGYATSPQVTGQIFAADMADPTPINLTTAVENMITAYNDAAGRPTPDYLELATGNIGGKTLTPGLYKWTNTVSIPSSVTISGGANDVWIFQIAGDLTMSSSVNITLNGGAQAKNIFWQVAGTVTIGTTSHFEGIIMSWTGITFQTGASMNGRALAGTLVALDGNAITNP